jgi:hypothetical protein
MDKTISKTKESANLKDLVPVPDSEYGNEHNGEVSDLDDSEENSEMDGLQFRIEHIDLNAQELLDVLSDKPHVPAILKPAPPRKPNQSIAPVAPKASEWDEW